MARTGLYKSEVKKARDALIAQRKHPSVDAVRIALGNTGSKTTIHKYLKELQEEDGGAGGRRASISEALQDFVERLAAQLQVESNAQIDTVRVEQADQEKRHAEALAAVQRDAAHWREQAQQLENALHIEREAHGRTREVLQRETIARHTAEQHATNLNDRLAENEAYRQSLEDKHRHAREALEHYRQSVKEQRDQDLRRHEQQIQQLQAELRQAQQAVVVKQEEVTRLNQDGVRLVSELTHTRQALHEAQQHGRRALQRIEALQAVEQRNSTLLVQLTEKGAQAHVLQEQLATATEREKSLAAQVRDLELALTQSQTKVEAQQEIMTELRTYLESHQQQKHKE
jgi:hypothetical protein